MVQSRLRSSVCKWKPPRMAAFMQVRSAKVYKERRSCRVSEFKKLFRFEEENVKWISDHFLGPEIETRGGALSPEQKMKTFLRYLADPGFQVGVGEDVGVHQSTVSRTVEFVSNKIVEKADLWIKFPRNQEAIEESRQGDQADPSNYRGIALMSTIVKVFTTILADRLTSWANVRGVLPEEQAGFRAKRSCTDHIFTLHAAACLCLMKKRQPLVTVMVDLKRAFDSVCHDKLWSKLEKIGVSGRIIRVLVSLYSSACFLIQPDPQGERFEQDIMEGVLQGDCLSPLLFILFLSDLGPFMDERGCHGLRIGGKELSQLIFADDLALLADSVPDAQRKVNILQEYCRENSLSINVEKSKVLIFRGGGRAKKMKSIYCENVALEVVPSFQYLGVLFSRTGKFKQNKDLYISKARRALGCTKELFYKGKITSWESRSRLFQSMVESVLLYASEVWGIWYMDDLEIVQSTFIKSALCLPRSTPGHFLRVETGSLPVKAKIFRRTVHYWQKILNMEWDRWPRLCYEELLKAVDDSSTHSSLNWVRRLRDSLLPIGMGWLLNDPERVQTKAGFINCRLSNN
ncbi:unnamed protein product [Nesidiocoris tenuis]|uniref:Reverse transcriptase domain-containing protein n=1 Tax=Nesidiocoris tenuis TaxID=355587 RepID=A0A6H5G7Z8_9HEMI|nr:unnamed protein product [Nesidiocoris tenuis]